MKIQDDYFITFWVSQYLPILPASLSTCMTIEYNENPIKYYMENCDWKLEFFEGKYLLWNIK